ncbi:hypothetical protein F4780DRAFT_784444 [Xylariomycetidae sp. FL0641]|nr:hypothetical protein F4780DRAFT_784444 [Xylariomycetidae sp. FL0641]
MSHPQTLFPQTSFHGPSLLATRRATVAATTVQTQLQRLRDSGQYRIFDLRWQPGYGDPARWPVPPPVYWDSDVAKWIEGACYVLHHRYDAAVDAAVRELVAMIRGAQQDDGYLDVYFTVVEPGKRWTNLRDQHELYNAGHMIEAALAHNRYYKNDLLLEPIQKYVKLIRSVFGPGENQRHGYPGHPEIELALLRLYTATGSEDAYELARYFIEERGNPTGQAGMRYYEWEREQRGDDPWKRPDSYPKHGEYWYSQAHAPILEQKTIEGHAVRAMYLLTGVADLLCLDHMGLKSYKAKAAYSDAIARLWGNMIGKKMSLTGGIGAMEQWEGFGIDYFLPQGSDEGGCYNETCASIGCMMLAERMLHVDLDSKYADIMELSLYNAVMTGMSLDGRAFTYVNQLASSESDKSGREAWFETSCCPPNVTRLFGSIGGYLWDYGGSKNEVFINVHLYTTARVAFDVKEEDKVVFEQESNWPWEGKVRFQLQAPSSANTTIRLRIPAWAEGRFTLTPVLESTRVEKGYLILPPAYTSGHTSFSINIHGFQPRFISPHPYTNQNTLTLARGPLIYCVEDSDNPWEDEHFRNVGIKPDAEVTEQERTMDEMGERYIELRSVGWVRKMDAWDQGDGSGQLSTGFTETVVGEGKELTFIPYYLRANRGGRGQMRVGLLKAH